MSMVSGWGSAVRISRRSVIGSETSMDLRYLIIELTISRLSLHTGQLIRFPQDLGSKIQGDPEWITRAGAGVSLA